MSSLTFEREPDDAASPQRSVTIHKTPSLPNLQNAGWFDADEDPYTSGLVPAASTAANIVKGVAGAAVFAMPYVFMEMGAIAATVIIALITVISTYTMVLLLHAKKLVAQDTLEQYISYVDISRHAFGEFGAYITYVLSVTAALGIAAANVTFVGSTVVDILKQHGIEDMQPWYFTVGSLVFVSPLTWLRNFKILSTFSIVGNVCLVAGVVATIAFGLHQGNGFRHIDLLNVKGITGSLGTVSFVFCVNFLILPIERSMQRHSKFVPVLVTSFGGVAGIIVAFGWVAYSIFSEDTCSNSLANLKPDHFGVAALKGALCIAMLCAFPLAIAPACETIEQSLMPHIRHRRGIKRRILRQILIFASIGMSQMKSFRMITNLVGGLTSLPLTLIIPPALYIKLLLKRQHADELEDLSSQDTSESTPLLRNEAEHAYSTIQAEETIWCEADNFDFEKNSTSPSPSSMKPTAQPIDFRHSIAYGDVLSRRTSNSFPTVTGEEEHIPTTTMPKVSELKWRRLLLPIFVLLLGIATTAITVASTVEAIIHPPSSSKKSC